MSEITHTYEVVCSWSGSTKDGYRSYDRTHLASAAGIAKTINVSADGAFGGDATKVNPEQLLVMAVVSCQMLSFLAVAARARIDVLGYDDIGVGQMEMGGSPVRVSKISLHPKIKVALGTNENRVRHLVEVAHRECFISNSVNSEIAIIPEIEFTAAAVAG